MGSNGVVRAIGRKGGSGRVLVAAESMGAADRNRAK